jgi:hypothetical protein
METPFSCPRCHTQSNAIAAPGRRAYCRRCRVARAAGWAAGAFGLLLVAGGLLAALLGGWLSARTGTNAACTCPDGRGSQAVGQRPCETAPGRTRRLPPPNAALNPESDRAPGSGQPHPDEATHAPTAPTIVAPLGGGRLLHPGVPGLLLYVGAPMLL